MERKPEYSRTLPLKDFQRTPDLTPGTKVVGLKNPRQVGECIASIVQARYGYPSQETSVIFTAPLPNGAPAALERGTIQPLDIPAYMVSFTRPFLTKTRIYDYEVQILPPDTNLLNSEQAVGPEITVKVASAVAATYNKQEFISSAKLGMRFTLSSPVKKHLVVVNAPIEGVNDVQQAVEGGLARLKKLARKHRGKKPADTFTLKGIYPMNRPPYQGGAPGLGKRS